MDERILIGAIVGLGTVSSIYIWKSEDFSKAQKVILLVCILFLPLQWILAVIMYFYNKKSDFIIGYRQDNNIKSIDKLKQLKDAEILSEEEYEDKIKTIENQNKLYDVKKTNEYKSLINLNKQGILTDYEFDEKVDVLKNKINKTKEKINNNTISDYESINNFKVKLHNINIPNKLKGELKLENNTLIYMLTNPNQYIDYFKNKEFPFYCALVLDRKGYKLKEEHLNILDTVAKDYFEMSGFEEKFNEMKIKNEQQ